MSILDQWSPENPAPLDLRVFAQVQLNQSRRLKAQAQGSATEQAQQLETLMEKVADATRHPYHWARHFTKTFNPHWVEEHRPSPYEPFPDKPYFRPMFDLLMDPDEPVYWWEKSRDMMVSWGIVAFFLWQAMKFPERRVLFQTMEGEKATELVDYAKVLYGNQPDWLKEAHPLVKPADTQAAEILAFANGSEILRIPSGKGKIRFYHPWGLFNDESAFQPYAGDCYNESISAVKGKIVFNSSANPGWFADAKRDISL